MHLRRFQYHAKADRESGPGFMSCNSPEIRRREISRMSPHPNLLPEGEGKEFFSNPAGPGIFIFLSRTCLKFISPSPRGVRRRIAKGPVDLLPAERAHTILVRPGREYRLGGGGEIRLNTILNFLAAFLIPTPCSRLAHQNHVHPLGGIITIK
jgi:hypothetical protein